MSHTKKLYICMYILKGYQNHNFNNFIMYPKKNELSPGYDLYNLIWTFN